MFNIFSGCSVKKIPEITKNNFVLSVQGMELKLSVEEITEFFNFCDDKGLNKITKS